MRKYLFICLLALLTSVASAQVVDNPSFEARASSIYNITRIERTPEETRLNVHVVFRPHWWVSVSGDECLRDPATGKVYKLVRAEGIELKKETYTPNSGQLDFTLVFEPLPDGVEKVDYFGAPNEPASAIFGLSLTADKKSEDTLEKVRGNWFGPDGEWAYGVYDSVTVMNNRIYSNLSVRKKGKRVELTLKEKGGNETTRLLLTPRKDGGCRIEEDGKEERECVRRSEGVRTVKADDGYQQFFRTDTACLQGYLDGYDPRFDLKSGLIYLENALTREDYPTVVEFDTDGSFRCKFVIYHPVCQAFTFRNLWIPFYIEPGQTLTMYIDWEEVLRYDRMRGLLPNISDIEYMGPSASLAYLNQTLGNEFRYDYNWMSKLRNEQTPAQFKETVKPMFAQWEQVADSLRQAYQASGKAQKLIGNRLYVQQGTLMFDFLLDRDYLARTDTANQALKAREDDSYYDFLRQPSTDDETLLADNNGDVFINRFEFMDPFQRIFTDAEGNAAIYSYRIPRKPLLSFLKEKGVKLSPEADSLRRIDEKMAGKIMRLSLKEAEKRTEIQSQLKKEAESLMAEYRETYSEPEATDEEQIEAYMAEEEETMRRKDELVERLSGVSNPFIWQVAKTRELKSTLDFKESRKFGKRYAEFIRKRLTHPELTAETERILAKAYPATEADSTYRLPEGKATDIFRGIIDKYKGKVVFVDFWATTCGPCRSGIEHTAELRRKYKNHPEFQFVYITSEEESPEKAYNEYVEKHLKGEECYRIPATDYHYLRQLFRFNGIPHYELIEKDGSVSKERVEAHNLEWYLKRRFGGENK